MPNPLFYYEETEKDFFLLAKENPDYLRAYTSNRVPPMEPCVFEFVFDIYLRMMKDIMYRRMIETIVVGVGSEDIINPVNFFQWTFEFMPYLLRVGPSIYVNPSAFAVDPYLKSPERMGTVYCRDFCCILPIAITRALQHWDAMKAIALKNGKLICNSLAYGVKPIARASYSNNMKGFKNAILHLINYRMWMIKTEIADHKMIPMSDVDSINCRMDIVNPLMTIIQQGLSLDDFTNVFESAIFLNIYHINNNYDLFQYLTK